MPETCRMPSAVSSGPAPSLRMGRCLTGQPWPLAGEFPLLATGLTRPMIFPRRELPKGGVRLAPKSWGAEFHGVLNAELEAESEDRNGGPVQGFRETRPGPRCTFSLRCGQTWVGLQLGGPSWV